MQVIVDGGRRHRRNAARTLPPRQGKIGKIYLSQTVKADLVPIGKRAIKRIDDGLLYGKVPVCFGNVAFHRFVPP
uniref:Uncharacterized protein n=1 Tax=Conchiformibius kuhniae TaxID=211502 RepID=A0A8T9MW02_9NEIS|nr:hypothetical protein LVJ77_03700 [Conchiformibius kuhniae]